VRRGWASWRLAVRLYLSSFRMGDHPEHLRALAGEDGRRAVVIANALDDAPADVRAEGAERELAALAGLGFDGIELDLRDYFGQEQLLRDDLAGFSMAWLRGGNVFMLRYALSRSGGDAAFRELLAVDALVYAGYSAGPCVLSPSLRGLELVDDAGAVTRIYRAEPEWDGLAVLDEAFVPHYQSPGHPETAAMDLVVARYRADGTAHRRLHDGQVLVVNGPETAIV
jgi:dipeptidase E